MAQFYVDENFPLPVVAELRQLGHNVLTVEEDGKAHQGYPDDLVLADASGYGRAVLTMNRRDFKRLHNVSSSHMGMILCTYDADSVALAKRIHIAVQTCGELTGQSVRITKPPQ